MIHTITQKGNYRSVPVASDKTSGVGAKARH